MMVEASADAMIKGNSVTSLATTVAVNWSPVDAPTTTVPAGRPQGMSRTGAPESDIAMVAASAPRSHGSGRCSARAAKPPATPAASVPVMASAAMTFFGQDRTLGRAGMEHGRGNSRTRPNPYARRAWRSGAPSSDKSSSSRADPQLRHTTRGSAIAAITQFPSYTRQLALRQLVPSGLHPLHVSRLRDPLPLELTSANSGDARRKNPSGRAPSVTRELGAAATAQARIISGASLGSRST